MRLSRDNWFLVVPTVVLGIAATITLHRLHAAGDVRHAVEIVAEYEAEGQPPLGEFLALRGPLAWETEVISSFYGTMDVICRVGRSEPHAFRWRVDVLQMAFAPADETTRELMAEYDPVLFSTAARAPGGGDAKGPSR